jgi:hypothetical protein
VASQADATEPVPGEDERQENNTEPEEDNYQGWWNWARWGQDQWSSQSNCTSENADWVDTTDELLPDFLQGWYLLADANLDTQERNLVQTAVAGDFSLERIAQELRSQFPEMDLMRRDQSHKPSSFWQEEVNSEDDDKDKSNDVANLLREGMNEEGIYLISEAEQEASGALVAMQQAKRTLREARAKQHQVRLSRQYYKVGSEKLKVGTTSSSSTSVGIKCFKCGGITRLPTAQTVKDLEKQKLTMPTRKKLPLSATCRTPTSKLVPCQQMTCLRPRPLAWAMESLMGEPPAHWLQSKLLRPWCNRM